MQKKSNLSKALYFAVLCIVAGACDAQSVRMSSEPFVEKPLLPFAPAPGRPAPAGLTLGTGASLAVDSVIAFAPADPTSASVRTWRVENSDVRLSTTLERWSKEAGYTLIWDAQKQVLLSAKDSFSGTLEQAITRALSSPAIRRSDYPLEACFYPNSPPVIRVTRLGEQAEECPL